MTEQRTTTWTLPGIAEPYSFQTGRSGKHPDARQYVHSKSRAGYLAARDAARDWKRASTDHAETSFYGLERIRAMRAFWLGVARGISDRDGLPPELVDPGTLDGYPATGYDHDPDHPGYQP